jgi:hypothetical protein
LTVSENVTLVTPLPLRDCQLPSFGEPS